MNDARLIDRDAVREIKDFLNKVLSANSADLRDMGFRVDGISCRFSPDSATFKVEIKPKASDGEIEDVERAEFEKYCGCVSLSSSDYGKKFLANGQWYTLCAIRPNNYKYPLIAKNSRGKRYKFPLGHVSENLV